MKRITLLLGLIMAFCLHSQAQRATLWTGSFSLSWDNPAPTWVDGTGWTNDDTFIQTYQLEQNGVKAGDTFIITVSEATPDPANEIYSGLEVTGMNASYAWVDSEWKDLGSVSSFPCEVSIPITDELFAGIKNGCWIRGSACTVTKFAFAKAENPEGRVDKTDCLSNASVGWSSSYDAASQTLNITGDWGMLGFGTWGNSGYDCTDYDYVVVEFAGDEGSESGGKLAVWGNGSNYTDCSFNTNCLVNVLALPSGWKDNILRIGIQAGAGGGTYAISSIYLCTEAYLQANGVADLYFMPERKDLDMNSLGSGWDSSYDASSKTISITGDGWSGRGWWFGGTDYSYYDYVVVRFAEPTATDGNINYGTTTAGVAEGSAHFDWCCLQRVVPLEMAKQYLAKMSQVYIMGPSGATFVLEEAYLCTEAYKSENALEDIYLTPVEYTFNSYGYGTFVYEEQSYLIPEGVTATYVTAVVDKELTEVELQGAIPANCAVIIKGEPGSTVTFMPNAENPDNVTGNRLKGFDETVNVGIGTNYVAYILSAREGKVGFYLAPMTNGQFTSEAHKAYLLLTPSEAAAAPAFVFDGTTTAISAVAADESFDADAPMYNLAGQRVNGSYKGVVIQNGMKKVKK